MIMTVDLRNLEKCFLDMDMGEYCIWLVSSYNKPLKSKKVASFDYLYRRYFAQSCATLPISYPRKSRRFCLANVCVDVFGRFIELLAPLTLYHFRQSCKQLYYQCLDLRGLEFNNTSEKDYDESLNFIVVHPYSGMLFGCLPDPRLRCYQIAYGNFTMYVDDPAILDIPRPFIKKYKSFILFLTDISFDEILPSFWKSTLHPGVHYASVNIDETSAEVKVKISLQNLTQFFGYCNKLHKLMLTCFESSNERLGRTLTGNPPFSEIKNMIENWSETAVNLETCTLIYKNHHFQLDCGSNTLKRCVRVEKDWFWSDDWDIDAAEYDSYSTESIFEKSAKFSYLKSIQYYDDAIKNYQQYFYDSKSESKRNKFSKIIVNKFKTIFKSKIRGFGRFV